MTVRCINCYPFSDEKWSEAAIDEFERLTKCARWVALEAHVAGYRSCLNGSQVPVVQLTYESSEEVSLSNILLGSRKSYPFRYVCADFMAKFGMLLFVSGSEYWRRVGASRPRFVYGLRMICQASAYQPGMVSEGQAL